MLSRIVLVALVLGLAGGCASDEAGSPGGESAPSASGPADPGATSEVAPSEPATPEVAPATGPSITIRRIDEPVFTASLPDDKWRLSSEDFAVFSTRLGERYTISGFANTVIGQANMRSYLRFQRETYAPSDQFPERGEDRVVGGVEGVTLLESTKDRFFFQFAAQKGEALLTFKFEFPKDTPRARAWVESVLASARWL